MNIIMMMLQRRFCNGKIDKKRHLAKTFTWRILAITDTFLIAWIITGKIDWAAVKAGIEVLTKMILYYWHERLWYKHIKFGVKNV